MCVCVCVGMRACVRGCVCVCVGVDVCILHVLRACSINWFVQSVSTLKKTGEGDWVHSRIRNLASSEELPACHTIRPLHKSDHSSMYDKLF